MKQIQTKFRQLDSLIFLRSIAVIFVVLCHYCWVLETGHSLSFLFKWIHDYGKYSVHIFFVISGFVIPYSLLKGGYQPKDYIKFLSKRIIRLHPSYIASLILTVWLAYIFQRYLHSQFDETIESFIRSIFYLYTPSDNPVYWTLIIEAQYYLFIWIFYILIIKHISFTYWIAIPILLYACQTWLHDYISLLLFLPFFLVWNLLFMLYSARGKKWLNSFMLFAILVYISQYYALAAFIASSIAIICILCIRGSIPSPIKFIGTISYSVYLIHYPLWIEPLIYLRSIINPNHYWIVIIISLPLIFSLSWIFYMLFEKMSERISKSMKYNWSN